MKPHEGERTMTHPLVDQQRFTRNELVRGLEGVSDKEDGWLVEAVDQTK
jgi:hypothetical protein